MTLFIDQVKGVKTTLWGLCHTNVDNQNLQTSKAYLPPQMVELPVEIWLHIVGFIQADDRRKLVGVNRVFFELIMDELYGQLNFVNSNPWELIETLMSLQYV